MWTSLLPLAWSARSPWRELTSIVAGSGLAPPPVDWSSPRLRKSASLYGDGVHADLSFSFRIASSSFLVRNVSLYLNFGNSTATKDMEIIAISFHLIAFIWKVSPYFTVNCQLCTVNCLEHFSVSL